MGISTNVISSVCHTAAAETAIREQFDKGGAMTLSALRALCEKQSIKHTDMHSVLQRDAMELQLTWWPPCVQGDDKAYVLATSEKACANPPLWVCFAVYIRSDLQQREVILAMFCANQTIKRADATEECRKLGEDLSATCVYFTSRVKKLACVLS